MNCHYRLRPLNLRCLSLASPPWSIPHKFCYWSSLHCLKITTLLNILSWKQQSSLWFMKKKIISYIIRSHKTFGDVKCIWSYCRETMSTYNTGFLWRKQHCHLWSVLLLLITEYKKLCLKILKPPAPFPKEQILRIELLFHFVQFQVQISLECGSNIWAIATVESRNVSYLASVFLEKMKNMKEECNQNGKRMFRDAKHPSVMILCHTILN